MSAAERDTQAAIGLIGANGLAWLLEIAADACDVEVDGGDRGVEVDERLEALSTHLRDVAKEVSK